MNINKILLITLSNIGDVVLTLPVMVNLKKSFPNAELDLIVGPRAKDIIDNDPRISNIIIYDKSISLIEKVKLCCTLKKNNYDLVIDLRSTIFPFIICPRYSNSIFSHPPKSLTHMADRHMWRLKNSKVITDISADIDNDELLYIAEGDLKYASDLLGDSQLVVVVSPVTMSTTKTWLKEGFAKVCDKLIEDKGAKVVMIGDKKDSEIIAEIKDIMKNDVIDVSGKTTLKQVSAIIKNSNLLLCNDSAPLHIAEAVKTKVVVIFGPTSVKKYGPRSKDSIVINKDLECSPCEKALCILPDMQRKCMEQVTPDEVFEAVVKLLDK